MQTVKFNPAHNDLLKVHNENSKTKRDICSKLERTAPVRHNFEVLTVVMLTLKINKYYKGL